MQTTCLILKGNRFNYCLFIVCKRDQVEDSAAIGVQSDFFVDLSNVIYEQGTETKLTCHERLCLSAGVRVCLP